MCPWLDFSLCENQEEYLSWNSVYDSLQGESALHFSWLRCQNLKSENKDHSNSCLIEQVHMYELSLADQLSES